MTATTSSRKSSWYCGEKFSEYDAKRSFGAWARGIAAKKILQRRGKQGRTPTPFPPDAVRAILDAFDRHESGMSDEAEALESCLRPLPEKSRRLLKLRYGDALGVKELADRLHMSAAAAFKALARLRQSLRECIERRLAGQGGTS
jgi:RNA polymerase sigma-70 factor (ECF subfamily)